MTTWVLLRGWMREARHWDDFPMQFRLALGVQDIVALDFPGNGSLHARTSAASMGEMADSCREQLRQLGYVPPYNVLALSMGGMVAVAWSELYPGELEKMVLINTSLAPYSPFYHRLRPTNYPVLLRFLLIDSVDQRESLILRLTSRLKLHSEHRQAILEQWTSYAREYPVTRANALRQLNAAASYRARLSAPPVPVLLLAAQRDELVNAKCSLVLAQYWRTAIRVHPAAGHDLPLDDGEWVARQIKEWYDD